MATTADEIDKNDHVVSNNLNIFESVPRNITFEEHRWVQATPISDTPYSQKMECVFGKQEYGLYRSDQFVLKGKIKLMAGSTAYDDKDVVCYAKPFTTMFSNIVLYVNDKIANNITNEQNRVGWVMHRLYTSKDSNKNIYDINLSEKDTVGHLDEVDNIAANTTASDVKDNGKFSRAKLVNNTAFTIIDSLDMPIINGYGTPKWITTANELKFDFTRANKNKYIIGKASDKPEDYDIHLSKFKMEAKMYKPNDQLATAINNGLLFQNKEAHYFVNNVRVVVRPVATGEQDIIFYDLFTGGLPSRVYVGIQETKRFNGSHQLNCLKFILPDFSYAVARVNQAAVREYYDRKEAYFELKDILNKKNTEIQFAYAEYIDEFGLIAFDLSPNQDSYTEILSNSNTGQFGFHITLKAALTANHTFIFFGEFRNQLNIGYKLPIYYELRF